MTTIHTNKLREWAKFFSGMIAADILVGILAGAGHGYGSIFLGIPVVQPLINIWIILDVVLLALLVHYAWHGKVPASPTRKIFYTVIGVLLIVVALAHFLRIIFAVPLIVGGLAIPFWLSVIGAIITGFLAYISFHFAARK